MVYKNNLGLCSVDGFLYFSSLSPHPVCLDRSIHTTQKKTTLYLVKSSGDCSRVPDSGRKLLIEVTVLLLEVPNQASQPNNR